MKRTIGIIALVLAGILGATAQTTDNMDRIEVCKQNYRTLFGGEALTGQGTDPEMMDILQKFIFGEVFQTGELTLKQREMITCITLATMQTLPQLKAHAGAALNVGVTPEELREVMYLTAPFIGFPKMLNAVATVNEVFKERGISLPLEKQGTVTEETRHKAGKAIQDKHGGTDFVRMVKQGECEERQVGYLFPTSVGVHRTGMEAARSLVIIPVILHKAGCIIGQICRHAAAASVGSSCKEIGGTLFVELPAHFIPLLLVVRIECSHRG